MAPRSRFTTAAALLLFASFCANAAQSQLVETARAAIRTKDYRQAITALTSAATKGDPQARYLLASMYRAGLGVEADAAAARNLLLAAANDGHANAEYALAASYAHDDPLDRDASLRWLKRAAEHGHSLAQTALKRGALPVEFLPQDLQDVNARRAAMRAAIRDDDAVSVAALADRVVLDSPDEFGRTEIAFAAELGACRSLDVLSRRAANVNQPDHFGTTPLMLAAASGRLECVQILLEARADAEATDSVGNIALMYAAARKPAALEVVDRLLSATTQPAHLNVQRWSALDWALTVNDEAVVASLRTHGLNARTVVQAAADRPSVPLRRAAKGDLYREWSDVQIATARSSNRLLEALRNEQPALAIPSGALVSAVVAESATLPQIVNAKVQSPRDEQQTAALTWAIRHGTPATVRTLLTRGVGADTSAALLIVAVQARRPEIVQLLLDAQIDVQREDDQGRTALMLAAATQQHSIVTALLTHLARVDRLDKLGRSALWYASAAGDLESVRSLIAAGSAPGLADRSGQTPLALAAARGHSEVAAELLKAGALRLQPGNGSATPLMLAALRGDLQTIRLLLAGDATVDAQNGFGDTALIVATRQGHREAVQTLLAAGASLNIRNADRMSALDVANALGLVEMQRLLSKT